MIVVQYDAVPSEFVPLVNLQRRLMSTKDYAGEKIIRDKMMALLQVRGVAVCCEQQPRFRIHRDQCK